MAGHGPLKFPENRDDFLAFAMAADDGMVSAGAAGVQHIVQMTRRTPEATAAYFAAREASRATSIAELVKVTEKGFADLVAAIRHLEVAVREGHQK